MFLVSPHQMKDVGGNISKLRPKPPVTKQCHNEQTLCTPMVTAGQPPSLLECLFFTLIISERGHDFQYCPKPVGTLENLFKVLSPNLQARSLQSLI